MEACNEEDLDCAGQLRNIQVRVGPFPIYYSPSVQSQAALVDANTLKCSALNAHCCADKRAKYVRFRKKTDWTRKKSCRSSALASPASTRARAMICDIEMPPIDLKVSPEEEAFPLVGLVGALACNYFSILRRSMWPPIQTLGPWNSCCQWSSFRTIPIASILIQRFHNHQCVDLCQPIIPELSPSYSSY